jgi:creatinine amidohydrolase
MPKMRTRLLSKMTNAEVEEYLARNSIVFVPVGTVELSGHMPMDNEYTSPAGIALACAEVVDALVLDSLKYFYAGATTNGRGSVQVSTRAGNDYLKEILTSLWCQGFKEIITISGHGPAEMTIVPCIWDFFDETKHHVWWINCAACMNYVEKKLNPALHGLSDFGKVHLGCYEIMNCKNDLVIDPVNASWYPHWEPSRKPVAKEPNEAANHSADLPESVRNLLHAINFATFSDSTGFYFGSIEDHGGDHGSFHSIEERNEACAEGLKQLRVMVEIMDMPKYISDIRAQQKYTDTTIKSKYHHLPKNRFSEWK